MKDLALFTQSLVDHKQQVSHENLKAFELQLETQTTEAIANIQQQLETDLQHFEQVQYNEQQKQLQTIATETKQAILMAQQQQLFSLFDDAVTTMTNWSQSQFDRFFNGVVQQLPNGTYTLICGQLTPQPTQLPSFIKLSSQRLANEAGFVFENDTMTFNYLYRQLVEEVKQSYMQTLVKQLHNAQ